VARRLVDDQMLDVTVSNRPEPFCDVENAILHDELGMRLNLSEPPLNEGRKISAKNRG
jgi:hypothetical protein